MSQLKCHVWVILPASPFCHSSHLHLEQLQFNCPPENSQRNGERKKSYIILNLLEMHCLKLSECIVLIQFSCDPQKFLRGMKFRVSDGITRSLSCVRSLQGTSEVLSCFSRNPVGIADNTYGEEIQYVFGTCENWLEMKDLNPSGLRQPIKVALRCSWRFWRSLITLRPVHVESRNYAFIIASE